MDFIKKYFINFYHRKGKSIGESLLKNLGIAAVLIVFLNLISKVPITIGGIFGWLMALPLFSVIVSLVRIAIKLVHKVIPMNPGLIKFILDFIIMAVVVMSLGFFLGDLEMPDSDLLTTILTLLFDAAYIAVVVFCLRAKDPEEERNSDIT